MLRNESILLSRMTQRERSIGQERQGAHEVSYEDRLGCFVPDDAKAGEGHACPVRIFAAQAALGDDLDSRDVDRSLHDQPQRIIVHAERRVDPVAEPEVEREPDLIDAGRSGCTV